MLSGEIHGLSCKQFAAATGLPATKLTQSWHFCVRRFAAVLRQYPAEPMADLAATLAELESEASEVHGRGSDGIWTRGGR